MKLLLRPIFLLFSVVLFNSCQKETPVPDIDKTYYVPVADGGLSKNITLPVNTTTLNGSGTSKNGPIVGYLWSLVSGPNVPVIQSPGSATTIINGFSAGNYIFQLMVIDSLGYTGVDTAWVRVAAPVQVTLTQQPTNNQSELNFAVIGSSDVSAHDIDLDANAWTSGGTPFYIRGAFKFDLTTIPVNATIISAKLSLYSIPLPINGDRVNANTGADNSFYIRRNSTTWSQTSTWQTQPGADVANQLLIPHTNQRFLDLVDVEVKNMVASMLTNGNYGFQINLQNETIYTARQFCSSKYSDAAKHPKLVVVYQ